MTSELPELDVSGVDQVFKDVILVVALGGIMGVNTLAATSSTVPFFRPNWTNRKHRSKEMF